jgi:hypothetical protein
MVAMELSVGGVRKDAMVVFLKYGIAGTTILVVYGPSGG